MNYDTVIIELLSRVQALEEKVELLTQGAEHSSNQEKGKSNMDNKITTTDIKNYIIEQKNKAKEAGKDSLVLVARDISNELQLKQRYPMICNAMRQTMNVQDEIIFSPASGYSSTLEIKYYL